MPERRAFARVNLSHEHTVRFVLKGHPFQGIRLANLSAGGCFILAPRASAGLFQPGGLLEQFRFETSGLPQVAITGAVAYAFAPSPGMGVVGVGVNWLRLPDLVEYELDRFVERLLEANE
ncbi:MAG: PilZ domain-containing protein [Acidobacteria bacterium]|nr:PilZ domain-containing protein [Acidobacteriota bacterium]